MHEFISGLFEDMDSGVKTPRNLMVKHDFISDGASISLLIPTRNIVTCQHIALSVSNYGPIRHIRGNYNVRILVNASNTLSAAVWLGIGQGIIDAILGRAGHH